MSKPRTKKKKTTGITPQRSIRQDLLTSAAQISDVRQQTHGSFSFNVGITGKLYKVFQEACIDGGTIPDALDGQLDGFHACMFMVLNKISRMACGEPNDDDFVDGCNYLAQAGEELLEWWKVNSPNLGEEL